MGVGTTVTRKATVFDFSDNYMWIQILSSSKRIKLAVPYTHPKYSTELQSKINQMDSNTIYTVELESQNEKNTKWIFTSIQIHHEHS